MYWTKAWVLVVAALLVGGCANNREMQKSRLFLEAGDLNGALKAEEKRKDLCGALDRAVLRQVQGDARASNEEFDGALGMINGFEARAVVSATEVGRGAGSVLFNDTVLEYQGEGFEKVLIHTLKAKNYLMLGDEEGARVEIRNANMRQDEERKRHADLIAEANNEASNHSFNFDDKVNSAFAPTDAILARCADSYQNPFATYLSGVVYELNGDLEDAFLDFKNAYSMVPTPLLAAELGRLGGKLHRQDELSALGVQAVSGGDGGNTLLVLDNGLAPARAELKFPVPAGNTIAAVAVPISQAIPSNLSDAIVLDDNGQEIGRTTMLVDVEAMSVRNLHDRYPAILTRQVIRLAAKIAASNAAVIAARRQSAEAGLIVQLFASVGNVMSEQADLRAWYQLPRSIHVARISLPAGQREVTVRLLDQSGAIIRDVRAPVAIGNGRLSIVGVRYINGQALTWPRSEALPEVAAQPGAAALGLN